MLILTGLSGAGKTVALDTLEDMGYYCVDNLPIVLLETFITDFALSHPKPVAVAIDSRNDRAAAELSANMDHYRNLIDDLTLIFLNANTEVLSKRYSESRRPHPKLLQSEDNHSLLSTIEAERKAMLPLMDEADIVIDTSTYSATRLKSKLRTILDHAEQALVITLQSFGFKNGLPINADYVFDVRFLPNPYWQANLRPFSGTDPEIIDYLSQFEEPQAFVKDAKIFLSRWVPYFIDVGNRSYLTIAVGCTGGQHRSVYVTEQLANALRPQFPHLHIEHRDRKAYSVEAKSTPLPAKEEKSGGGGETD